MADGFVAGQSQAAVDILCRANNAFCLQSGSMKWVHSSLAMKDEGASSLFLFPTFSPHL
jgi:hypothetical protein